MDLFYCVIFFMIISGLLGFCSMRKHVLLTLLSLEFLVVGVFLMFINFLLYYGMAGFFVLVFLTFSVCEGAMGLAILVSMIRSHGNDNVMGLSVLVW